jgi:hypothetical protein
MTRALFAPIETPPTEGWGSYESTERDGAEDADRAVFDDVAGFASLWTDRRFNECVEREVQQ